MSLLISLWACELGNPPERQLLLRTGTVLDLSFEAARIQGEIVDLPNGMRVEGYGHCWKAGLELPTLADSLTDFGPRDQPGSFESQLPGLRASQSYQVRAYIRLLTDTIYAAPFLLQTPANPNLPVFGLWAIDNISSQSAQAKAQVYFPGLVTVLRYGHCWNTQAQPTIDQFRSIFTGSLPGLYTSDVTQSQPQYPVFCAGLC
ncbi:MAG: hypothetical protein HC913_00260 [Microscillaceae bacterium]|nr:hypothetical protein [Microscillaceae bacterium]